MNYDLSEWDKRKAALLPLLDSAAVEGLVSQDQTGKLADFLLGRGVRVGSPVSPSVGLAGIDARGLDAPKSEEQSSVNEDSEAPRFIRGFHDILITIGIIIGLLGLGGLASVYAVIPAVIVLAEILVRRQRLALPAVVLTLAFAGATSLGVYPFFDSAGMTSSDVWLPVIICGTTAIVALGFFWRYMVPLALAIGLVSTYATAVYAFGVVVVKMSKDGEFFEKHPLMLAVFMGVFALLVFGTALRFDVADRMRVTRRSDVAFWMHLTAAPAILYSILALVFLNDGFNFFSKDATLTQAVVIVVAVFILMMIGIILDRRAFVTSGLLSFGYAFGTLLIQGGVASLLVSADKIAFVVLLAVGVVVLSLGIGWQPLRRIVIGSLPTVLRDAVPPVRG